MFKLNRGFESCAGQTKDYKVDICCFSTKQAALRSKNKDWWFWIMIMCPRGVTCLPEDCCVSGLSF